MELLGLLGEKEEVKPCWLLTPLKVIVTSCFLTTISEAGLLPMYACHNVVCHHKFKSTGPVPVETSETKPE